MKKLQFRCTLKSDIIINQKSASEGANSTLDFIPGSNFLGIAASELYRKYGSCEATLNMFHSGKVRFGDAHPALGNIRTFKVPAAIFYPKLQSVDEKAYVMYQTDGMDPNIKKEQLKQCRSGFYAFETKEKKAVEVKTQTGFAIKSAHDKNRRTSKDKQMYGYQSLAKGLEMLFEVEVDCEEYVEDIEMALKGTRRVGRSRSAQYGLVEIEPLSFDTIKSPESAEGRIEVYADSRLIFIDEETGMPTFCIKPKDLGIDGGEIQWDKSQIRTFQYSPWNYTRQCYDTDRCGIEKGSVIVVEGGKWTGKTTVGKYLNEGFGRIIVNPEFLQADDKGIATYKFISSKSDSNNAERKTIDADTPLLRYLLKKNEEESTIANIYREVNTALSGGFEKMFKGKVFASQWGTIRSMASQPSSKPIEDRLFGSKDISADRAYLTHGVAGDKWKERNRIGELKKFLSKFGDEKVKRMALINLASEMAKLSRYKEERKDD